MMGWPVTQKDMWTKDGLAMSFLISGLCWCTAGWRVLKGRFPLRLTRLKCWGNQEMRNEELGMRLRLQGFEVGKGVDVVFRKITVGIGKL